MLLMYACGLRIGEAAKVEVTHIDGAWPPPHRAATQCTGTGLAAPMPATLHLP